MFKHGRDEDDHGRALGSRHRTRFEIAEHVAVARLEGVDDDQARRDMAVLEEWWRVAARRRLRQCPWPPGLRAVFAQLAAELGIPGPLLEEEKSDEQVAEETPEGTEVAGEIGRASLLVVQTERDTLRAAGRDAGLRGVVEWCDQRGVTFHLSATGVDRFVYELECPPPRLVVTRRQ